MARLHKKVTNMRRDFHWKTAQYLTGKYALISIENLNLKAMQKTFRQKDIRFRFCRFCKQVEV